MEAQVGSQELRKANIHSPRDLIRFPWDNDNVDDSNLPTDDEVKKMQAELEEINKNGFKW